MIVPKEICARLSDAEILKRSLSDVDYFACIYERYHGKLLHYTMRIAFTGEEEAEDILQDAFIKIWKNLNEYNNSLKLSSWLYRIVHNEAVSFLRNKHSYGKSNTSPLDDKVLDELYGSMELETDREEKHTLTNEVLRQIPEKYRQYLILKFYEKMSYEEISDILKVPEGTVATRINRAKNIFRKIAEKDNISFNR